MTFLAEFTENLQAVADRAELDVEPGDLLPALRVLDDDAIVGLVGQAAAIASCAERLKIVGAAVIAERSKTSGGGLAQRRGFRNPVQLVQDITGGTRGDASRTVRVGSSLLEGDGGDASTGGGLGTGVGGGTGDGAGGAGDGAGGGQGDDPAGDSRDGGGADGADTPFVWHADLRRALLEGAVTSAQHDAIRRGLGEPSDAEHAERVWAVAARDLVQEAATMTVEDLRRRAQAMRDGLDPEGAERRFTERFNKRSWRTWTDDAGVRHSHVVLEDDGAAFLDALTNSALRPRRGGPRFLTNAERAQSAELVDDPRTNDQLTYDLLMSVIRAGALASADDVFGSRQPGVRLIAVKDQIQQRDPFHRLLAIAYTEDGGQPLPGSVLDAALCDAGGRDITVDSCGNPLDVGRDQRLFTPAQKIALAARDGGCMWPGCSMPASYCEAHHIEPWSQGGRTDTGDGILLCRFHHLLLHNGGWRITRDNNRGVFVLHSPTGKQTELRSKSPVAWMWDPPPQSSGQGWRTPPILGARGEPESTRESTGPPSEAPPNPPMDGPAPGVAMDPLADALFDPSSGELLALTRS